MIADDVRARFLQMMQSLLGGLSQKDFRRFVQSAWADGSYARRLPISAHSVVADVAALLHSGAIDTTDCYRKGQPPAFNATLWDDGFAVRIVSDPPDGRPVDEPISLYNIEPHFHFADSIIIVASLPQGHTGEYIVHRVEDGEDVIRTVPLDFGNLIAFPAGVNHTFKPSGNGLITINMTHELIIPHTARFGADAWTTLDAFQRRRAELLQV